MADRRQQETAPGRGRPASWEEAWLAVKGGRDRFVWSDPVVLAVIYLLAVSVLFVAFPALDLGIARLFFANGIFPAANVETLIRLRTLGDHLIILVLLVLIASLAAKMIWPDRSIAIRPRSTAFLLATLVLGPGLVVNGLFKSLSGRPRPVGIEIFGGDHPFVPAWRFSDYCASNCSFISGEASSAMWLMGLVFLAPKPLRPLVGVPLGAVALALSLNRLAFGGHFASDVLIAFGFTLLVMLLCYRVLVASPLGRRIDVEIEAGLARAGRGLRLFVKDRL